ncbi:MAG: CRISPR-associated protein Cas4 [Candidatus Fischerbacteria bacterium RBG_13_37_8]|uniref:CRISPR-associated exonuclease Cas4 n=1 Tax=Candidatus Fischerbacteria bacterium RBG_13_37_8 TaxID=1817863 RepID=A0A1F5V9R4_9BACT|nr:MAG: CRISPR-associated protein Cas4 [Candidatus Fischerbacteria bacterium RBG_13_37_8]
MNCLCIEQHEEKRYKVLKGREVHESKKSANIDYLRKRIGCTGKELDVSMASERYHIAGIVDEILMFSDGSMAPLDYKYAEYRDVLFSTHRYQSIFYGLLIKENYHKEVTRGFICYVRSKNKIKEIAIEEKHYLELISIIRMIIDISQKSYYPKGTKMKNKCIDCCYRNICA